VLSRRASSGVETPTPANRWGAGIVITAALGLAGAGCSPSSSATPPPSGPDRQEHEVFCMGGRAKCDGTAAAFCESRYGSREFALVRRVPERGALVISCMGK
jgi:hypothetical protein